MSDDRIKYDEVATNPGKYIKYDEIATNPGKYIKYDEIATNPGEYVKYDEVATNPGMFIRYDEVATDRGKYIKYDEVAANPNRWAYPPEEVDVPRNADQPEPSGLQVWPSDRVGFDMGELRVVGERVLDDAKRECSPEQSTDVW